MSDRPNRGTPSDHGSEPLPTSPTILIADDDPALIAALVARLSGLGYRCTTASCGSQALAQFRACPSKLVISDLSMPGGDGASFAEDIRRISSVPIILISGYKDEFRKKLRHIPDISFLHKPFSPATLLDLVQAAMAGNAGANRKAA